MTVRDKFTRPLQESLLALLAYDSKHGRIVAYYLKGNMFDGDYADFAARCIDYHYKYNAAPDRHIDDLFGDVLGNKADNKHVTYRQIIIDLLRLFQQGLNTAYLIDQVRRFVRYQNMRQIILDSAQRLSSREDQAIEEVEEILNDLLRARDRTESSGMRLTDIDRLLDFLEQQSEEFKFGINLLDERRIAPARGAAMLFLGATGRGKSWAMVHIGTTALQLRHKVLHITLEMPEEQVIQRYLQCMFSIAARETKTTVTRLMTPKEGSSNHDRPHRLEVDHTMTAEFSLRDDNAREELEGRLKWYGGKAENLLVKRFPSGGLTTNEIRAYLDTLEFSERFMPDMLIVDYLGLMKIDQKDFRHSLGRNFVDLRGLAQSRNLALVTAQQASRAGASSKMVDSTHVAEDWSLPGTADYVLTLSSTDQEKDLGLCRLFVSKGRDERDRFGMVLTQNYALGQFAIDAVQVNTRLYQDDLEGLRQQEQGDGEDTRSDDP